MIHPNPWQTNKFDQYSFGGLLDSFVRLSLLAFVFPDLEPTIISILFGWSGICDQFGLCCSEFSPGIIVLGRLIDFALLTLPRLMLYGYEMAWSSICSLLSSFALRVILLTFYADISCNLLPNLCSHLTIAWFFQTQLFPLLFCSRVLSFFVKMAIIFEIFVRHTSQVYKILKLFFHLIYFSSVPSFLFLI